MNDPVMANVLLETENMLARGKMDLPLNLSFAAIREDDLLLHQLLKRGLDPNESDNNGRTPLVSEVYIVFFLIQALREYLDFLVWKQHIAASKGSLNCVLLLLDYHADPNCRGTC